jgi:hypothetical protein
MPELVLTLDDRELVGYAVERGMEDIEHLIWEPAREGGDLQAMVGREDVLAFLDYHKRILREDLVAFMVAAAIASYGKADSADPIKRAQETYLTVGEIIEQPESDAEIALTRRISQALEDRDRNLSARTTDAIAKEREKVIKKFLAPKLGSR